MDRLNSTAVVTLKRDHSGSISKLFVIGHVNEYPTMHYFGIPRRTQSMIAYIYEIPVNNRIVGILLTSPIEMHWFVSSFMLITGFLGYL